MTQTRHINTGNRVSVLQDSAYIGMAWPGSSMASLVRNGTVAAAALTAIVILASSLHAREPNWTIIDNVANYPTGACPERLRLVDLAWSEIAPNMIKDNAVKHLWITRCEWSKTETRWAADVVQLKHLESLILDDVVLQLDDFVKLRGTATLVQLEVRNTLSFTDECAIAVGQVPSIRKTNVTCERLTEKGLTGLTALGNLTSLTLRAVVLASGALPRILQGCPLVELNIQGVCQYSREDYVFLSDKSTITILHLNGIAPSDEEFVLLKKLPLTSLSVANILKVSDGALGEVIRSASLTQLEITFGNQIDGSFLREFGKSSGLEALSLRSISGDTPMDLKSVKGLTKLREVQLSGLRLCTELALQVIGEVKSLEVIRILDGENLTREALMGIQSFPAVREIEIYWLSKFTMPQLQEIAEALQKCFKDRVVTVALSNKG